jgi:hypothetical protein
MEKPTYFVKVNLRRFVENGRREGEPLNPEAAKLYLRAWGLKPCLGNVWRCDETTVDYLRPDEIETKIRA